MEEAAAACQAVEGRLFRGDAGPGDDTDAAGVEGASGAQEAGAGDAELGTLMPMVRGLMMRVCVGYGDRLLVLGVRLYGAETVWC